jgi:dTDP-4-dehydrorhamnose 3,5-epimerase/CDP-3, 6-dideoxy-D-glycero-D-glycero-4-hexulose-5-epimerase
LNINFAMAELQLIQLPNFKDARGLFVKSYNESLFQSLGIQFSIQESYYSVSALNVIRGMHFQLIPYQHAKIVFCPVGAILDVALDLRKDSATYGQAFTQILSAENNKAFYIPEGFAHGFKSLTENALTYYLVSSEYNHSSDTGIAFDSFGFNWECNQPILSDRDRGFVKFEDFNSPF